MRIWSSFSLFQLGPLKPGPPFMTLLHLLLIDTQSLLLEIYASLVRMFSRKSVWMQPTFSNGFIAYSLTNKPIFSQTKGGVSSFSSLLDTYVYICHIYICSIHIILEHFILIFSSQITQLFPA